jgi:fido (protein-threonine AMPylation protein)
VSSRRRDEQETRNTAEVMAWIEHLAAHPDVSIDLDLVCHINRVTLRDTGQNHWAGRVRAEVDWQQPEEWPRPRAIVAPDEEHGLAVKDRSTGEVLVRFPPDREVGPLLNALLAWLNSPQATALHPVVRAAIFHQRLTAIHPFRDGNGRTARALTTLLLRRDGFPIEILALQRVMDERRNVYIATLQAADQGDLNGWLQFFTMAVRDALQEEI